MTDKSPTWIAWAFLCLSLLGCDEQNRDLQTYSLRLALDGAVVFADSSTRYVRVLDVSGKSLEPVTQSYKAQFEVVEMQRRKGGHDQALLFLRDLSSGQDDQIEASALAILSEKGVERTIPLEPKFTKLEQSLDGKYVVVYGSGQSDHLLDNQAEVSVVDLEQQGESAVALRALDGLGAAPVAVAFAPEMSLGGVATRLLIVLANDAISIIDMAYPSRRDTTINLGSISGDSSEVPQLAFDAEKNRIYAVRFNSPDVVVIDLVPEEAAGSANAFRPVLSTLSLPSTVATVELYLIGGESRILCALPLQNAVGIVDPVSGDVQVVPVSHQVNSATTYQLGEDPQDVHALLLGPSDVSSVSLRDVEAYGSGARVRSLVERKAVGRLVMVDSLDVALVVHSTGGLSLLDFQSLTATPFATKAYLTDILVDLKRNGAWIAAKGEGQVAFLDLPTKTQRDITLDAAVEGLLPAFKQDRVIAFHDSPWGYATLIDTDRPVESHAEALLGFLASGIAD